MASGIKFTYFFLPRDQRTSALGRKMEITKNTRKRLTPVDVCLIHWNLEKILYNMPAHPLTAFEIFAAIMPVVHAMRRRDFSFEQVTEVLHSANLPLSYNSVRNYYYRLYKSMDIECERYARKQSKMLKTVGTDVEKEHFTAEIAYRVSEKKGSA